MQWSKLRKRIKSLVCPELRERIDFYVTSYRQSHDGVEKAWVTLDGEEIFNCGHYDYEFAFADGYYGGMRGQELMEWLGKQEIDSPSYVVGAMRAYLDISIDGALRSEGPFIKGVAIIDRRVGNRAIEQIKLEGTEHSVVKRFYEQRRGPRHV